MRPDPGRGPGHLDGREAEAVGGRAHAHGAERAAEEEAGADDGARDLFHGQLPKYVPIPGYMTSSPPPSLRLPVSTFFHACQLAFWLVCFHASTRFLGALAHMLQRVGEWEWLMMSEGEES